MTKPGAGAAGGEAKVDAGAGAETALERSLNRVTSSGIHLFLTLLALVLFAAAVTSSVAIVIAEFPKLWQLSDEYSALESFIRDILLVAIAAELGLLLLFHRTAAAIEVLLFVVARKMIEPEITGYDLLFGAMAIAILIAVRFHYLTPKPKI